MIYLTIALCMLISLELQLLVKKKESGTLYYIDYEETITFTILFPIGIMLSLWYFMYPVLEFLFKERTFKRKK